MSHFSVLVVGEEVEAALAPFHEFECTGEENEYVQNVDVTENYATLQDVIDEGIPLVPSEEIAIVHGEHKFGFAVVEGDRVVKVVRRTNPNAKWDWWVTGGRFTRMLRVKPGARGEVGERSVFHQKTETDEDKLSYDMARKRDVDFEFMRSSYKEQAESEYDRVYELTNGRKWRPYESILDEVEDRNEAPMIYRAQPEILAIRQDRDFLYYEDLDQFLMEREAFIKLKSYRALTFAILYKGEWIERGKAGWWGSVTDEKESADWNEIYWKILDSVSDDDLLTVVDCHI